MGTLKNNSKLCVNNSKFEVWCAKKCCQQLAKLLNVTPMERHYATEHRKHMCTMPFSLSVQRVI